jgi:glycosyltransferase involved in cell wall biosynthesis
VSGRPLRVLNVITRMIIGGAQETVLLSCALMDRERFACEILTGPQTGSEGELHAETRACGIPLHVEPALVRELDPLKDAVALVRLVRFLRVGRYDLVHTHTAKAGVLGRVAARLAGIPLVAHTVHGWEFGAGEHGRLARFYLELERWLARWCQALVVVADIDRQQGLALGVGRPEQYALIRSGIEPEVFRDVALTRAQARRRIGVPEEAFVIGQVGRLARQKAPLDLLGAFERVARERSDAHLVLLGDGPQRAEVEAEARRSGLAKRVHVLGMRRDVPEILRALDVLALASRWEGLPRVLPQAMAAGLPIVATRVSGAPEAVVSGENGWLVNVGDLADLAARLLDLARDPVAARLMGEAGRARVGEFSATRMVRELESLYERLARRAGVRS